MRQRTQHRPTSWIGWLFEWFPGPSRCVLPAALVALFIAVLGLLLATLGGFAVRYATTPQIWILVFATAWVFAWGAWSTRKLYELPDSIGPALRQRDDDYERFAREWRDAVMCSWANFVVGGSFFVVVAVVIWLDTDSLGYFPESWEETGDGGLERSILTIFFFVACPLFVTMLWGFGFYVYFTRKALQWPLVLAPHLARMHLRPITNFGLRVGLGWSVATMLATAFFLREMTIGVATFLAGLGVMGVTLILLPQAYAHNALVKTRDELVDVTAENLQADDPRDWVDKFVLRGNRETQAARSFLAELDHAPVWIYVPAEGIAFVAGVLVPVAALVLSLVFGE